MPGWIIAAVIGSIAITALLTFVLWRMNAPMLEKQGDGGDGHTPVIADADGSDGGGDGGGD